MNLQVINSLPITINNSLSFYKIILVLKKELIPVKKILLLPPNSKQVTSLSSRQTSEIRLGQPHDVSTFPKELVGELKGVANEDEPSKIQDRWPSNHLVRKSQWRETRTRNLCIYVLALDLRKGRGDSRHGRERKRRDILAGYNSGRVALPRRN